MLSFYWMTAKIGRKKLEQNDYTEYVERRWCVGDRTWYTWNEYYDWAYSYFGNDYYAACHYWHNKMKVADATEMRYDPHDKTWYKFGEYFCFAVNKFGSPRAASHHWNDNMKKHRDDSDRQCIQKNSCASGDLDQVSSVNVEDRKFPDLRGTVNPFDSPRAASDDCECEIRYHVIDSDPKASRRWGKFCMEQDSSVNVADRLSPDLRGIEVCTPHVAEEPCKAQYFDISDGNGNVEVSRVSGSMPFDWVAEPPKVPEEFMMLREPPTAYKWVPDKCMFYCRLCYNYATPEHIATPRHQRRGLWPEWFLRELWPLTVQWRPSGLVDWHAVD